VYTPAAVLCHLPLARRPQLHCIHCRASLDHILCPSQGRVQPRLWKRLAMSICHWCFPVCARKLLVVLRRIFFLSTPVNINSAQYPSTTGNPVASLMNAVQHSTDFRGISALRLACEIGRGVTHGNCCRFKCTDSQHSTGSNDRQDESLSRQVTRHMTPHPAKL
jgi:hypothetical protein